MATKKAPAKKTAAKKAPARKKAAAKKVAAKDIPVVRRAPATKAPQDPTPAPVLEGQTPLDAVAQEVIEGKWNTGRDRDDALRLAGHNPQDVMRQVIKIKNRG